MVGIFDSGKGGCFALGEFRRMRPQVNACFLADKENAPYGIKNEKELVRLVIRDIERLLFAGARISLMACCTASTVYDLLPNEYKRVAIPIIKPTSMRAVCESKNMRIGVICTSATAKSNAFEREILKQCKGAQVVTVPCGELVTLVEGGAADGCLLEQHKKIIEKALLPLRDSRVDTLILGCTHFAGLEREIQNITGNTVINSARVGAELLASRATESEEGVTVYLS